MNETEIINSMGWNVTSRQLEDGYMFILAFDSDGRYVGSCITDNLVCLDVTLIGVSGSIKVKVESLFHTKENTNDASGNEKETV